MVIRKALIGLLPLLALLCIAQQVEVRKVPIKPVDPQSGEKMYMTYCAVCHGADGKGVGPAATAMKVPPTNLRTLSKANGGKYPSAHVFSVVYGDTASPEAHGSREMPVWGSLFSSLCSGAPTAHAQVQSRVNKITSYVESLQEK